MCELSRAILLNVSQEPSLLQPLLTAQCVPALIRESILTAMLVPSAVRSKFLMHLLMPRCSLGSQKIASKRHSSYVLLVCLIRQVSQRVYVALNRE